MPGDVDLLVRGARVVDARADVGVCDVAVADGVVQQVGVGLDVRAERVVDAAGLVVMPGVVDSHAHLASLTGTGGSRSPAHERLARAGVTTAVEFYDFATVLDQWHASAAGIEVLGLQALRPRDGSAPASGIGDEVAAALDAGSIGIKLLGGHFPSTPDASARAIAECADAGCYVAFHAGTTAHGSDLSGMREAVELADGHPLHLAHTNAYLRGAVADELTENETALALLRDHGNVVSESHLAPLNMCSGELAGDGFADQIVVRCLRLGGYPTNPAGLAAAFTDGYAHCLAGDDAETPATGRHGYDAWRREPGRTALCFPVNRRISGFLQACARVGADGTVRYDGEGEFVVDAIASDGGSWRNLVLRQGLTLVQFGALTLPQLAHKTSRAPALLYGLHGKGLLEPGADADLVVVDVDRRDVRFTVAGGRVVYDGERVVGTGGTVLTTERGAAAVRRRGVPVRVLDLSNSLFLAG